jgi:thioredoxin 1
MIQEITDQKEFEGITQGQNTAVVSFFADWCIPCREVGPKLEAWSEKFEDKEFYKVNVDELMEIAEDEGISCIPTIIIYKSGCQLEIFEGTDDDKIKELFKIVKLHA